MSIHCALTQSRKFNYLYKSHFSVNIKKKKVIIKEGKARNWFQQKMTRSKPNPIELSLKCPN